MESRITQIFSEGKKRWILSFILLGFSAVIVINSMVVKSPLIGTVVSLGFLSLVSVAIGEVFFSDENLFFKCLFGLAAFLLLLGVSGFGLMLIGKFTEVFSLVVLVAIGVFFCVLPLRGKRSSFQNSYETSSISRTGKRKNLYSYLVILLFFFYVAIAFRFLLLARTGEGGSSVWLEISPMFIPIFAIGTLILCSILFFSHVGDGLKLVLLSVYTFLAHSLFLIVWYPSRYGDPLALLGHARYTARTGTIYAFDWLTSHFLIEGIIAYRAQFALTIFFERMFSVDIYWVHMVLVPLLWSIFVPCIAYKLAELLTLKRSRTFPLLTALSTGLFPSLILWGAASVPNSLGFIFLFLSTVLLLKWMNSGGKWNWFVCLLAVGVTFLTHPQPGLFALVLFLWGNIIHRSWRTVLKIASLLLTCALYPVVLYFYGVSFSAEGLFLLDNLLSFQSEIITVLFVLGLLGLILGVRDKYVNGKSALILFSFYVTVLFEYYLTEFGMTNMPYGPARVLVIGDFFLVPFVALGLLAIVDILRKAVTRVKRNVSLGSFSKKAKVNLNSRLIALTLICLFVSLQATSALYQAYPRKEAIEYQPSAYMIDAVRYINTNASGRYVVLCDPIIASVAIGFLGIDYAYGAARGAFGMPDWEYPLMKMYWDMTKQPSINITQQAMDFRNATICYFVVWVEHPRFETIVQQTAEILPVNRVFNSSRYGKELSINAYHLTAYYPNASLAIFKYPLPLIEKPGPPVKVTFDDGVSTKDIETSLTYMFETEINSTLTLSGYTSYNITAYPMNWVFLDLTVNNASVKLDDARVHSSDVNTFIYIEGLNVNDVVKVTWQFNSNYLNLGWKEDSFMTGRHTHERYKGTITPQITRDGNILSISHSFITGESYEYYYYEKSVNVSTDDYDYIMIRWRSTGPIATAYVYFEYVGGQSIMGLSSESISWTTTVVKLTRGLTITSVMVGITDLRASDISGLQTLYVDYILICAKA